MREFKWHVAGIVVAAFALGLSFWHVWTDHRILHELVIAFQQHEQTINATKAEVKAIKDLLDKKADKPS